MASNPYGDDPYYPDLVRQQTMQQLGPQWNPAQLAAGKQVQDYYKSVTGNDLSADDALNTHLSGGKFIGPQNIQAAYRGIAGSAEAQQAGVKNAAAAPDAASPTAPGASTPAAAGGTQTGWGYDSPTGGHKDFQYTPQSYGGGFNYLEGFRDQGALDADPAAQGSIKYIFRNATEGLNPNDPNALPTVVQRLQQMGITGAQMVGDDQIDFGMGEGPMDVIRGKLDVGDRGWQWIPGGQPGSAGASGTSPTPDRAGGLPVSGTMPVPVPEDTNSRIMALIQELIKGGTVRDSIMGQLG